MSSIHDPYLNTAKRTLEEKKVKQRQQVIIENKITKSKQLPKKNDFLSQNIDLPENLNTILLVNFLIFIPYLIGLVIIYLFSTETTSKEYINLDAYSFMLLWTIGYELIAFTLLTYIIKSAFSFKKR